MENVLYVCFCQWEKHHKIMSGIWNLEDFSEEQKREGFELAVNMVTEREQFNKIDVEVIIWIIIMVNHDINLSLQWVHRCVTGGGETVMVQKFPSLFIFS